ncbi:MAG TPA: VWA domain-containing protein [Candidatus Saccharimonadales bacterium]|nr:VWA domain-containing protein [Candidatus Saccharimonadales bacterium]
MKRSRTLGCLAVAAVILGGALLLGAQDPRPDSPTPKVPPGAPPESSSGASQAPAPQKPAATPAPAQNPPAAAPTGTQKAPTIRTTVTEVIVPVTVKDKYGNLVADLKKDEFRIFEDDVEQFILKFANEPVPLSIVVLIDNDLKTTDEKQVEPSLVSIVAGLSNSDEAFICRFDQNFYEGHGFTRDQDKLMTELRRTDLTSHSAAPPVGGPFEGPTINNAPAPGADPMQFPSTHVIKGQPTKALDDAVYGAAELLKDRDAKKRRKVILLISDGRNGSKFNTHKYDEVLAELLRQQITVYSVATGSAYFDRRFDRLVSYAHNTGGDVYFGAKQTSFSEFYPRISEEARNQYVLVYSPQGDRKVDYHTIEVRVRRPNVDILTRKGYYGGTFATEPPK